MQTWIKQNMKPTLHLHDKGGVYRRYVKRLMDFILSLLAIIVLSPVLLLVALLVRVKLGSPILFKQERPGLNEKIFTLYKFRTMVDKKDENGILLPDSVRLTSFGNFLRSTSLDELPELFNILKGDMSIIGPRPLLVQYLPLYNEYQRRRHKVRPGLSGLAQINGRNAVSWEDRLNLDVKYVYYLSFILDWKIIFITFKKALLREGISSDTSVTMEAFKGSTKGECGTMKDKLLITDAGGHGKAADIKREIQSMNILFLSLPDFSTIDERGIYTDLMRELVKDNKLYIISPSEKRKQQPTRLIDNGVYKILKVQIGNIQKTNMIEKGISTLTLESKFQRSIKQYFSDVKFDLIIYSTPPITLQKVVKYVKKRDNAKAYLLLKDIFPQNAVDLCLMRKDGFKGFFYKYFKAKEKKLYELSDYIGCMSKANVDFLLKNNPEIPSDTVEICPNSIEPLAIEKNEDNVVEVRNKYNIPSGKTIFIYGGNLGKPQGIDFLIQCLRANKTNEQVYFIIAGSGTEFGRLKAFFDDEKPDNAQLLHQLPRDDYEVLANSCDVGLIFLDKKFTIPNFPSRLLSYMQASIPVLAATDVNTDLGKVIEKGKFGLWCESRDVEEFKQRVQQLCDANLRKEMGANARTYLENNYTVKQSYEIIMSHFK